MDRATPVQMDAKLKLLWPSQMATEKFECLYAMNHVWPVEKLDLCPLAYAHFVVEPSYSSVLIRHPLIGSDAILVASSTMNGRGAIRLARSE